jgi:hypothetical protein
MTWRYPPELLDALTAFGLAPTEHSEPRRVRQSLNALYRYELRRERDRLLARKIAKPEYLAIVIALRKRYWPLSMLPEVWEKICS